MQKSFTVLFVSLVALFIFSSCNEEKPKASSDSVTSQDTSAAIAYVPSDTATFKANITSELPEGALSILQDRNSNYWFGTQNSGVYRYDGKRLIRFTTKDGLFQNQVKAIQEDEVGNIWFTTGGYGISCFDGKKVFSLPDKNGAMITGNDHEWKSAPGDLWFYGGGGAFRYHNSALDYFPFPATRALPSNQTSAYGIYSILSDRNGNVWFGTQAMGVGRFDGKSFSWLTEKELAGPAVLALFEDSKGNLWFGNNGGGLYRYDGKDLVNLAQEKGLTNPDFRKNGKTAPGNLSRVWSIGENNNGNIWIGTGDSGVWRYDGNSFVNYTSKNGLPEGTIEAIYKDLKGDLWFGTTSAGVYKFNGVSFEKFTFPVK